MLINSKRNKQMKHTGNIKPNILDDVANAENSAKNNNDLKIK